MYKEDSLRSQYNLPSSSFTFDKRDMATRVSAPGQLLCVEELERKLTELIEHVELKKQEVRSNFKQLHEVLM